MLIASHSNEKVVWVFPANSGVSAASVMSCSWIGRFSVGRGYAGPPPPRGTNKACMNTDWPGNNTREVLYKHSFL